VRNWIFAVICALGLLLLYGLNNRAQAIHYRSFPCMTAEDHNNYMAAKYQDLQSYLLAPHAVATFKKNYDALPPTGDANITNVMIYAHPRYDKLYLTAELNGCYTKGGAIKVKKLDFELLDRYLKLPG
jgi:hypothetical protein